MSALRVGSKVVINVGRGSFNGKIIALDGDTSIVEYKNTKGETVMCKRNVNLLS